MGKVVSKPLTSSTRFFLQTIAEVEKKLVRYSWGKRDKERNKFIFDELLLQRKDIEKKLGFKLEWDRKDDLIASRIKYQKDDN